jgi:hypothetical protein
MITSDIHRWISVLDVYLPNTPLACNIWERTWIKRLSDGARVDVQMLTSGVPIHFLLYVCVCVCLLCHLLVHAFSSARVRVRLHFCVCLVVVVFSSCSCHDTCAWVSFFCYPPSPHLPLPLPLPQVTKLKPQVNDLIIWKQTEAQPVCKNWGLSCLWGWG